MQLTPTHIVSLLDQFVIGQPEAKAALAVAIRDRWRVWMLDDEQKKDMRTANILLRGPTGTGKTYLVEALNGILGLPVHIISATNFTQGGYVGGSLSSVIPDFVESNKDIELPDWYKNKPTLTHNIPTETKSENEVVDKVIDPMMTMDPTEYVNKLSIKLLANVVTHIEKARNELGYKKMTYKKFGEQLPDLLPKLLDRSFTWSLTVEPMLRIAAASGYGVKANKCTVREFIEVLRTAKNNKAAYKTLYERYGIKRQTPAWNINFLNMGGTQPTVVVDESKMQFIRDFGVIFIDEIDKLADSRGDNVGGFGVQRELLTLIQGQEIKTASGTINTKDILWIAGGAFESVDEKNILPELLGRLPITARLNKLVAEDFENILRNSRNSVIRQEVRKLAVEGVKVTFSDDLPKYLGQLVHDMNEYVLATGARRIQDITAKLLRSLSMNAHERAGETVNIDVAYAKKEMATYEALIKAGKQAKAAKEKVSKETKK